ncbi:DUF4360 domain-containing protein [Luedemannella flava]|uniref:DUF4360 domain-containing protein n=1 Tax=Luedemannella flava TaxID=349316 RepID=A0ABN2LJ87_9ACTN
MRRRVAALAGVALSLLMPATAGAAPGNRIVIDVVTANGSGCPIGTTAVAMSPDNTAMTVTYSHYSARVGAGAGPVEFRRNCQLNLNVHVPNGLTFAVASVDYRGFGHLERGAAGLHQAAYYFQGQGSTQRSGRRFFGPMDDDWQVRDEIPIMERVYRPCGVQRNININTELRVYGGQSDLRNPSFLNMDSSDVEFSTKYNLTWKACPTR